MRVRVRVRGPGRKGHCGTALLRNVDSSERRGFLGQVMRRRVLCPPRTRRSETGQVRPRGPVGGSAARVHAAEWRRMFQGAWG